MNVHNHIDPSKAAQNLKPDLRVTWLMHLAGAMMFRGTTGQRENYHLLIERTLIESARLTAILTENKNPKHTCGREKLLRTKDGVENTWKVIALLLPCDTRKRRDMCRFLAEEMYAKCRQIRLES